MKISHILVHWSESPFFVDEEQEYSLTDFEALAFRAAMAKGSGGGYDKTKITVFFEDTDVSSWTIRLDLAENDTHGLNHHVTQYLAFLKTKPVADNRTRRIKFLTEVQQASFIHAQTEPQ